MVGISYRAGLAVRVHACLDSLESSFVRLPQLIRCMTYLQATRDRFVENDQG